jgi:glycosyltransferase involved in cell wall biosynthesis
VRIAHVSDCYLPRLGGIEIHVSDLAARQRAAGHEVTVITSTRGLERLESPGIVRVDPARTQPARISYRRSAGVRKAVGHDGYDVIHVHASAFSPLAYLAAHYCARHRIPAVLTVHSLWARATPLFQMADRLTHWTDWPVEWTAVSHAAAAALTHVLAGRAVVTIVPNGVDPDPWLVPRIAGRVDELRLVAVGRLAPRKRTMHLAHILLAARRRLPNRIRLSVEIVGEGSQRRRLERYLARHGMSDWVRLRGALDRDEIRGIFARSDVFVAPAVLESFGIAALEARCAGLPVLARAGTGVQEFIDPGVEGWLVDSDREMADLIVDLALDQNRLEDVAVHNRRLRVGINWSMVLDRYDRQYRCAAARLGRSWPVTLVGPEAVPFDEAVPVGGR